MTMNLGIVLGCCRLLGLLLLASAAGPLSAQTPTPNTGNAVAPIKTQVRLVLVDVVVTNGKREAVTGLHKEDFDVLEDGRTQDIATFEEHHGAPLTEVKLPPLPPHVYTNFPSTQMADSVNVLLLDALNTPMRDQSYVHSQMIKYLKTIPPGTRVAIFTLASRLRMLQEFTSDSSELLAVLNNEKAGPQASSLLASETEKDANQHLIDFMTENASGPAPPSQTQAQAMVDPIGAMKQFLGDTATFQTESRVRITLQALQQLARYLSGIPCRKNVIWFSGSFPINVFPDPDLPDPFSGTSHFQEDIRKTADLLTAGQVAIYPIAAEGLASDSTFETNNQEISEKRGGSGYAGPNPTVASGQFGAQLEPSCYAGVSQGHGRPGFLQHQRTQRCASPGDR
jgi:VWFA-related protein